MVESGEKRSNLIEREMANDLQHGVDYFINKGENFNL